jgi:flagellar biosynthesis protein FlhF
MRFEKFEASDMRAALAAIKASMGSEAVIVATRELSRGGLFRRPRIEVTAAIEEAPAAAPDAPEPARVQSAPTRPRPRPELSTAAASDLSTTAARAAVRAAAAPAAPAAAEPAAADPAPTAQGATSGAVIPGPGAVDVRALDVRLAPLRRELRALRGALKTQDTGPDRLQLEMVEMRQMLASLSLRSHGASSRDLFSSILEAADVAPDMRQKIVLEARTLAQKLEVHTAAASVSQQVRVLKEVVAGQLMTFPHFFEQAGPRRVALAGPTGVGKTTTIAKLAAHAALKHGQRVALISLDTYRIGAQEQIGHYARLIDVPLVVAHDAFSFKQALQRFASYDLVLIDTAGRSPLQVEAHRTQLAQLFAGQGIQVYLIMAGATRWLELSSAMQELSAPGSSALILTKLDEAVALGSCVNASHVSGLPIAFVTTGQRVPEDLAVAAPQDLAARLVDRVFESTRCAWAGRPTRAHLNTGRPLRDQVA